MWHAAWRGKGAMFGRVTTMHGPPDRADEFVPSLHQQVLPEARRMEGFMGLIGLLDPATGKGMTISLWESEEAMRASEEAAQRLRAESSTAIGAKVLSVERYELVIDERP
jgi:heme-degrading monooxygenase HmoA